MKFIERVSTLAVFSCALLFTQSASAYLFNYTSKPLAFVEGYLDGEVNEYVGVPDLAPLSFNISFDSAGKAPLIQLFSSDLVVSIPEYPVVLENSPAKNSRVSFNSDGSIAGWDLSFAVSRSAPQIGEENPYKLSYFVESHYGAGTCNCDTYKDEWDLYIQRQDKWQFVSTLGFLYSGTNSLSNWTVESTEVPEPSAYWLMLMGLIAVGVKRMRNKEEF